MTGRWLLRGVCLAACAASVAGCGLGAALRRDDLVRNSSSIASAAHEGVLLARAVEQHRSPAITTRVRAQDLINDVDQASGQIGQAPAGPQLRGRQRRAVDVASSISDSLTELYRHPDAATAHAVRRSLAKLATTADALEQP